ncbi:MAG: HlyD family efflux transporter periplasmic adaptor subunit [Bacteroidota bacterium]|nr:HlyD family secretion protein [Candidatus Kapabacteria bacterium]MCS7302628.1 HlyD family secretion protein [Candidatus Kapabacteria bacterium]MCX7936257.1 HlyD family secretion protein [Chlorobiota bacterium]MDW8074462.1 HlyD family efflux transporter periplasmic adaptor subunit [Bacteroidota bacterium]MDW8271062.1 HlyD family efflux transporter periplasmic adaptor subunit [Bacteroidota bacterium]
MQEVLEKQVAVKNRRKRRREKVLSSIYVSVLEDIEAPPLIRRYLRVVLVVLLLVLLVSFATPWVQTVIADGRVTALNPVERPQYINAQITGRLVRWYVTEGMHVAAGDTIAVLQDIDPKFLDPNIVQRAEAHVQWLQDRAVQLRQQISAISAQLDAEMQARQSAINAAEQYIIQSQQRLTAARALFEQETLELQIAEQRYRDRKALYDQGLRSLREFESARLALQQAQARYNRAQAELRAAESQLEQAQQELQLKRNEWNAKVEKTRSDLNKAQESLSSVEAAIAKAQIEKSNIEARRSYAVVRSPIEGIVVRLYSLGPGETVKQGEPLAIVMPEVGSLAVELLIKGNDAPLVYPGQKVRIQFDGFPALQISGFPQVNVGTFGGVVSVVDAVDDDRGSGMFRAIVKPDTADEPWPNPAVLRPGTKARGWMLLNTVPLAYEIWRQLNGFPPSLKEPPPIRRKPSSRAPFKGGDESKEEAPLFDKTDEVK